MRALVEDLCSDACAGRETGTDGGRRARSIVVDALRSAGLDPVTQDLPDIRGANVLATLPGDTDPWVMIAAHYDHLGTRNGHVFRGADDNAASVAVLVEAASRLVAHRPEGRGVIFAAFDAEEPPYFATGQMGSQYFVRHPLVPLERLDMMICLELIGHTIGGGVLPDTVGNALFVLGGERSEGTPAMLDALSTCTPGLIAHRADAEIIPPLSDHLAFWEREVPFMLLSGGRPRSSPLRTSVTTSCRSFSSAAASTRFRSSRFISIQAAWPLRAIGTRIQRTVPTSAS
jgi:Zn-dependent M28 family amino/carboxypeptidase